MTIRMEATRSVTHPKIKAVNVNGKHVLDSPFSIEVKLFQLKPLFSFGKYPWGVAVNARNEIAVTDCWNLQQ